VIDVDVERADFWLEVGFLLYYTVGFVALALMLKQSGASWGLAAVQAGYALVLGQFVVIALVFTLAEIYERQWLNSGGADDVQR
jgi:hypothetical protein